MPFIAMYAPAASGTTEAVTNSFSNTAWAVTLALVFGLFLVDFVHASRNPHEVSMREAGIWTAVYVAAALVFGATLSFWGPEQSSDALAGNGGWSVQFLAGYITEKSLSVDNLFIFVLIFSSFAVPKLYQQKVLMIGIVMALVLRLIFILVGAAALAAYSWLFYFFGGFLIYTAIKLITNHGSEGNPADNKVVQFAEKIIPTTREYHDGSFFTRINGKRVATPLFIVMIAIFMSDLLFALDSIPAIFGLTSEPYIVFTANAFALMGLRPMFFLLDGLLDRLVYLTYGLAAILGFIGVKLLLHAMHESGLDVPVIGTLASLAVIIGVLVVTVLASLWKVRKDPDALQVHDLTGHHHPEGGMLQRLDEEPPSGDRTAAG
jgi:tellurite resistance protein TerC